MHLTGPCHGSVTRIRGSLALHPSDTQHATRFAISRGESAHSPGHPPPRAACARKAAPVPARSSCCAAARGVRIDEPGQQARSWQLQHRPAGSFLATPAPPSRLVPGNSSTAQQARPWQLQHRPAGSSLATPAPPSRRARTGLSRRSGRPRRVPRCPQPRHPPAHRTPVAGYRVTRADQ
jgi:hypothetical protein